MNKLIVFNHKMSLLYDDLYNYSDRINNIDIDDDIIICPSSIYLESFLNNYDYEFQISVINLNRKNFENETRRKKESFDNLFEGFGRTGRTRDFR